MKLKFSPIDLKLRHTWTIASGATLSAGKNIYPVVLAELTDAQGVRGLGEASPSSRYAENWETVTQFLSRVDASRLSWEDIPASMAYLETIGPGDFSAKAAINIALWDAAGHAGREPIYTRLGLGFQEGRHVTSFSIGIDRPEVIREKVAAAGDYPILKLKVGAPQDRENIAALREAAPRKTVRVDANEGWSTKEQALREIEWLAQDGNIEFVEQPMPATQPREDWLWLKERSPLPIILDESYHHASDIERVLGCCHGVNVKLVKTGGISGAYDALKVARERGLKTMLGCMIESSILISAAAQLAELTDYLDLDGNLLITNDPYEGPTAEKGLISFAPAAEAHGLRVRSRPNARGV